jgi:hypothetical protein
MQVYDMLLCVPKQEHMGLTVRSLSLKIQREDLLQSNFLHV